MTTFAHAIGVFTPGAGILKLYDAHGYEITFFQARNDAIAGDVYTHDGRCPPGEYALLSPEANTPSIASEGAWFVPLDDVRSIWTPYGRSAIGIHGGGSALAEPLAPRQGWAETEGCIRLQNEDLTTLVSLFPSGSEPRLTVYQGVP